MSASSNSAALGLGQIAFVFVRTNERTGATKTARRLARIPQVQEVHHIAGEDCFLVKVRAANAQAFGELLRTGFGAVPSVISTRSTIVLNTLKEVASFPLPQASDGAPRRNAKRKKNRSGRA